MEALHQKLGCLIKSRKVPDIDGLRHAPLRYIQVYLLRLDCCLAAFAPS